MAMNNIHGSYFGGTGDSANLLAQLLETVLSDLEGGGSGASGASGPGYSPPWQGAAGFQPWQGGSGFAGAGFGGPSFGAPSFGGTDPSGPSFAFPPFGGSQDPCQGGQSMWEGQGCGPININFNFNLGGCGCDQGGSDAIGGSGGFGGWGSRSLSADAQSNTVTTRGGWQVVADGNTNWRILDPCGNLYASIGGDPHLKEDNGLKWDFSKDSAFTLPDGSTVYCDTSSQTGHSVTQGLTVVDGDQMVNINGVNGTPTLGAVSNVGGQNYEWQKDLEQGHGFDHYQGLADGDWIKQGAGRVTGSTYDGTSYVQTTDGTDGTGLDGSQNQQQLESALWSALFGTLELGMSSVQAGQRNIVKAT